MFCISSINNENVFVAAIFQSISFSPESIGNVRYQFRQIQIYETIVWGLFSIVDNFDDVDVNVDIDVAIVIVVVVVEEVIDTAVALLH